MGLKNWYEVIDEKLPESHPCRDYDRSGKGLGARLGSGRIWTDEDYEARRLEVLKQEQWMYSSLRKVYTSIVDFFRG